MLYELKQAGVESIVEGSEVIDADHFGARYISLRSEDRFFDQVQDFDGGLIVWPGGSLAERLVDRYGFEHFGLYNSDEYGNRPGLAELMEYCNAEDKALSVILPTSRYVGEEDMLRDDIRSFFDDLLSGEYGELPKQLIFEIGNEYYANYEGASEAEKAAAYGQIANIYGQEIARLDEQLGGLPENIEFSFQAGRSVEANDAILDEMDNDALSMVDMISHHRFSPRIEAADKNIEELHQIMAQWDDEIEALGGEGPGLYLSAYNVSSLSRAESLDDYIESLGEEGEGLSRDDFDLEGRTDEDFERFYQAQLSARPVGISHAESILELYSQYSSLGIEAAGVYGWDLVHGGRSSLEGSDGNSYVFAAGSMQDMMAESLMGTRALDWYQSQDNLDDDRNEEATAVYGFESEDKLVVFVSNPNVDGEPFEIRLSLADLNIDLEHVWGERLIAEAPENWKELFGVQDSPNVDQYGEEASYGVGIRSSFEPVIENDQLVFNVEQDQIVRLSFAKSEAGYDDISSWQEGEGSIIYDEDLAVREQALAADNNLFPMIELEQDLVEEAEDDEEDFDQEGFDWGSLDLGSALLAVGLAFLGFA